MLETSPLLSNRYKRISSSNRPPSPSSSTTTNLTKSRRKSSITFLLALTAISAVVTYYYDTNLAPYEQVAKDGTTRFAVNEDFLTSVKLGSTVDEYGYRLSDEQRALARSMNVEKRIMAMTKDVWPECMAQHMQADVCKDFIDSEIATYFTGADRYIKTYIKAKRDDVDEWYNVIDMVMDDNNLVIGETGDGVVYYPFMWDGSGQEATVEAQTAIPPIIATETESGSQEAEVLTTVYAPMTAETEFMLRTAAATTTVSSTTTSSGSGSTPQVTPPPTPNPTLNPTPNPVAPPPTTNSGQTNPQSSGFTPSTWAPVTPAPTDQPATNEPTVSPTTNEPTISPTTQEPTTGTPTIAVTDAMTAQPQVQVQAQNTVVVNSGVSGSAITPPPTKDPTQQPTPPPTFPPTPPPTPNPTDQSVNDPTAGSGGGTDPNVAPTDSGGAFDFQQPPLVVSAEPLISPGATTDGARSGTDTNPLNGGVVLSSNSHGTTEGLEELNRILAEPAVIEDAGPRMVGPFNCAGMTGYECCLIVKHQVRDSDVNGNAIQCHLDYDVTTCKKKYELEQLDNKKVYIYANHKYFVSKDPKVSNTWSTCTTKWTDGLARDWSEKDSSWSNRPTTSSYGNPTLNPTNKPTRQPTPQPTDSSGAVAPPLADLVPSTAAPCPAGYECLQDANFGVDVPTAPFKIDLVTETMNSDSADAYKTAMNHWQEIIVGDLESVSTLGMANDGCSNPFPEVIDDMHICGKDTVMDGVGGTLGSASAMYERVTDGTVIAGNMEFDTADVQAMIDAGTWESVIIHEMGHIIGIGSQWASKGVVQYNEQTGGYTYTGANGINVWKNVWQCSSDAPPIETDGGGGTAGLHWDEACMLNERMTGYVNPVYNPTSLLTIANLADMGYVVDFTKAQAYDGYNMNNNIPGCCNPPARLVAATLDPTPNPTNQPTPFPTTAEPTPLPTPFPTTPPVADPTPPPSPRPTDAPTPPPTNYPTPNPTEQPTPLPTPNPTFAQANVAAFTAVPTTASPTQQPTIYSGQLATNVITGEECVIPGSNTCSVEHDLSACDGNKPYCCNRDNGKNNGDYDKCTTQGGVRSCKAGIASPNTCGQIKPSSNAKNNEVGEECQGGLFCCIQEQGNKKWGSCMTQAECEAETGGDRRGLFSSFGALRNLAQDDDEDDNTCKKKKDIPWRKKDKAWKMGMQKLRERKLPSGQARIQAGVKYVGDQKVSLLVEDEGMLYEVEVSADGSVVVS